MTEVDPAELVRAAVTSLHAIFVDKGVAVELRLPDAAPRVRGDRDRLTQVLVNLMSNALKFVPQGSGRIRIDLRDGDDELTISVADNGPGIAPDKHEEVFEEFRQALGADGARPAGTGLGLAICRRIVEHLGGRIWVEGVPPQGATFRFTLPRQPAA